MVVTQISLGQRDRRDLLALEGVLHFRPCKPKQGGPPNHQKPTGRQGEPSLGSPWVAFTP
jgi:hypothetical protein